MPPQFGQCYTCTLITNQNHKDHVSGEIAPSIPYHTKSSTLTKLAYILNYSLSHAAKHSKAATTPYHTSQLSLILISFSPYYATVIYLLNFLKSYSH